jgi:hypothetical protein
MMMMMMMMMMHTHVHMQGRKRDAPRRPPPSRERILKVLREVGCFIGAADPCEQ